MRAIAALLSLLSTACAHARAEEPFPVAPMPADEAIFAYAVIPDVARLVERLRVLPFGLHPRAGGLAARCQSAFGDLAALGLDPQRPLLVAATTPDERGVPGLVALIPAAKPAALLERARAAGFSSVGDAEWSGLATSDAALAHAGALRQVAAASAAPSGVDLRLRLSGARAWTLYGENLRDQHWFATMLLAQLPRPAGAPDFAPLMRVAMGCVGAVGQDVAEAQVDVACAPSAIDLALIGVAHEGSALAKALVRPPEVADAAAVLAPGAGITAVVGAIDPRATGAFVSTLLRRVAREQALPLDERAFALADRFAVDATGAFALRVLPDPVTGARCALAHGVASASAGKELELAVIEQLASGGSLAETCAKLGAPLRVEAAANARASGGLTVDRLAVAFGDIAAPPEQQAALLALARDGEVAYGDRWVLYDQDPAGLDAMIARASDPAACDVSTRARAAFGPGHALYLDCDVPAMIVAGASRIRADATRASSPLAALPVGDPVVAVGDLERGAMRWRARVPVAPFAPLARAVALAMLSDWLAEP